MLADMEEDEITQEERDDIFVREYVKLRALKKPNAAELACVRAGITNSEYSMRVVADRQLAKVGVQRQIMVLEERGVEVERQEISRDLILDELQDVYQKALGEKSFSAAITAVKTQAQLLGMLDQTVNVNHTVSAKDLDLDTLRAMVSERARPVKVIEGVAAVRGIGDGEG